MFLAKLREPDPEQFMFITLHEDYLTIKHTGEPMSEEETREALGKAGMPEIEISSRIARARQHPI